MPSYNFKCNSCGEKFLLELTIEDREALKPICPECGSEDVFQTFDGVGVLSCSSGSSGSPG